MSETKHSPAPWKLIANGHDLTVYPIDSPYSICSVVVGYRSGEINRANAQLIAAAPELLAALKNIVLDADRDYKKAGHLGDKIGMLNAKHMRVIAWRAIVKVEPDFL